MRRNTKKITKEFCQGKVLLFYPQTEHEAEFIQRQVFRMGYEWGEVHTQDIDELENCVAEGMELDNGELYYGPPAEDIQKGLFCTSGQFDKKYLSDRELMIDLFNKLSARIDAIYEELQPKVLDKPAIRKPGTQP